MELGMRMHINVIKMDICGGDEDSAKAETRCGAVIQAQYMYGPCCWDAWS